MRFIIRKLCFCVLVGMVMSMSSWAKGTFLQGIWAVQVDKFTEIWLQFHDMKQSDTPFQQEFKIPGFGPPLPIAHDTSHYGRYDEYAVHTQVANQDRISWTCGIWFSTKVNFKVEGVVSSREYLLKIFYGSYSDCLDYNPEEHLNLLMHGHSETQHKVFSSHIQVGKSNRSMRLFYYKIKTDSYIYYDYLRTNSLYLPILSLVSMLASQEGGKKRSALFKYGFNHTHLGSAPYR